MHLGEDLDALFASLAAGRRAHDCECSATASRRSTAKPRSKRFVRATAKSVPKFVYLDMEEYRDLALTAEAFMRTLGSARPREGRGRASRCRPTFPIPPRVQRTINAWAQRARRAAAAPVAIRLVKGREHGNGARRSSLRGWPQAPFKTKRETGRELQTDARRSDAARESRARCASAWRRTISSMSPSALVLAQERQAGDRVQFEMLEGMANHQRRALSNESRKHVLLYAPACRKDEISSTPSAISSGGSTRIRDRRIFCGTPSGSVSAATTGWRSSAAFAPHSRSTSPTRRAARRTACAAPTDGRGPR